MKSDRILILNQFFHPEYVTASVLITELAEDLTGRGIGVDVICGKPREYLAGETAAPLRETYKGIRIRRIGYLQMSRKSKIGRIVNHFSLIAAIALRWPLLLGYGLIVVNTMPPLLPLVPALMNVFFRRKFAFVCYDLYPDLAIRMGAIKKGSLIDRVMSLTNRLTYRRAECIVALGNEMKRHMLLSGLAGDEGKIEVIPNWYDGDPALYTPMETGSKPMFTVVYSGNMGICQDMETIMECIGLLKHRRDIRFEFAGHGVKADALKARAVELAPGMTKFHGYLMGNEFAGLLSSADCFIVSLEQGMEGLAVPSKTYSYLAAGRPVAAVISADTDIARMLKEYDAGFTVGNGEAGRLASVIEELAADRKRLSAMGANARRLFEEHYKRETCTEMYYRLFKGLLQVK